MTTIACDGHSMSGDGRTINADDVIVGEDTAKVVRVAGGAILGLSGRSKEQALFVAWYEAGREGKLEAAEFTALVLEPGGRLLCYDGGTSPLACTAPQALGSGKKFALGAMHAGKSAEAAVRIAMRLDPYSGGKVVTLYPEGAQ